MSEFLGEKFLMSKISAAEVSMGEVSVGLRTVRGKLKKIRAPRAILVIAEGWPSCLISILALKLPLVGAYFPRRHHHHFKIPTNARFDRWHSPSKPRRGDHTYVISGSVAFMKTICSHGNVDNSKVIACFEQNLKQGGKFVRAQWDKARKICSTLSLSPVTMRDMQFSGATNARFLFGFGGSLDSSRLPQAHQDIQRSTHALAGVCFA